MKSRYVNISGIVRDGLCLGCGACAALCPDEAIILEQTTDTAIRPVIDPDRCSNCKKCVKVCPGPGATHRSFNNNVIASLAKSWGPVIKIWQGYAKDPDIRFKAASGGVATALALFGLAEKSMAGVLHTAVKPNSPLQNMPAFSRTREELLLASGSRYSPASPCAEIDTVRRADGDCIFIGKGCDIQAVENIKAIEPNLRKKIKLTIGIFCAGSPVAKGTLELLEKMDVKADNVQRIDYRGSGWPGKTTIKTKNSNNNIKEIDYKKSWGDILSKHIQPRCRLCPDSTAEFADISCGDAWYKSKEESAQPGLSLILTRTQAGAHFLREAVEAGYVELTEAEPSALAQSQVSLLNKRSALWGRLLAMRIMNRPHPTYKGFHLFPNWVSLPIIKKIKSFSVRNNK